MEPTINTRSLHESLINELQAAIVSGELQAGHLYSIASLAAKWGVSRTPVREAMLVLARQGMVKFERNQGVRIQQITLHDLEEIFQLLLLLEVPAVRKATRHMTAELYQSLRQALEGMREAMAADNVGQLLEYDYLFHHIILSQTGNERLANYVNDLHYAIMATSALADRKSYSSEDALAEHGAVMRLMQNGDADAAAGAMYDHIRHTAQVLITQAARTPSAVENIDLDWTALSP